VVLLGSAQDQRGPYCTTRGDLADQRMPPRAPPISLTMIRARGSPKRPVRMVRSSAGGYHSVGVARRRNASRVRRRHRLVSGRRWTADDEEEEVAWGGRRHNRFRFVSWLLTTQVRLVSPIGPRSPELIGAVCVKGRPAVRLDAEAVSRRVETLSALPSRDRNIEFAASWIDAVRDDG
jgi:hypothetical protein